MAFWADGPSATALPHRDAIQSSFGPEHDVSGVSAQVGPAATLPTKALGARALTVGEHTAFGQEPDLRLAAHEAAHVVQQRAGVTTEDEEHEGRADAVAERVAAGRSAADLLPAAREPAAGLVMQRKKDEYADLGVVVYAVRNVPPGLTGRPLKLWIVMRLGRMSREEAEQFLVKYPLPELDNVQNTGEGHISVAFDADTDRLLRGGWRKQDKEVKGGAEAQDPQSAAKSAVVNGVEVPPDIAELMDGTSAVERQDPARLRRVVDKLTRLPAEERALYGQLVKPLAGDLAILEQALDASTGFRDRYRRALEGQAAGVPAGEAKSGGAAAEEPSLEDKVDESWGGVDIGEIRSHDRGHRVAKARELAGQQRNLRLRHMVTHPGETAVGMVKSLNPAQVAEGVWTDVKEATSGKSGGLARWAAGAGGVSKLAGWIAAAAGVAYALLLFVPGVNVAALLTATLSAGVTAIVLSTVAQELRIQAAGDAGEDTEFRRNVDLAAEEQVTAITGAVMLGSGFVMRLLARVRLPGRLQTVGGALRAAQKALAEKTGLAGVRAKLLEALRGERADLPEALVRELAAHDKLLERVEGMTGEQLARKLAAGDAALQEATSIGPERARQILDLEKTPAGKGIAEKLRQDFLRAMRDAPTEAWARVDRVARHLDEVMAEVEAAKTPEELSAAVGKAQARLDQKALADEAAAFDHEALRERLEEEIAKEPDGPRIAEPPAEAPPGMTEKLQAARAGLKDPRAVEAFDEMFQKFTSTPTLMEKAVGGMKNVEERLVSEWERKYPQPQTPHGEALAQVPELTVRTRALLKDAEELVKSRGLTGGRQGDVVKRLRQIDEALADIAKGKEEASASTMDSLRGQLDGLQGELRAAYKAKGLAGIGIKKFDDAGEKSDVDLITVAEGRTTWVDTKRERPFTTQSDRWAKKDGTPGPFQEQVVGLLRAAKARRNVVEGKSPSVLYDFEYGVTQSVHDAMIQLGRQYGVDLEVHGLVLSDERITVPPLRSDDEKKQENIENAGGTP